jgi:hypothetical protein
LENGAPQSGRGAKPRRRPNSRPIAFVARIRQPRSMEETMSYHLEGRLLEVCNCRVLCPCWIGEDPDFGTCDTIVAWHMDQGTIEGVDVAGCTIVVVAHVPGGPIAELAKLIGKVVSVERAPITFDIVGAKGTLKIGTDYYAELEPYVGPSGAQTTLADTVFSTVPGAPVFVGKAPVYRSKNAAIGINVDIKNHNALQSTFLFDA